MKKTIVLIIAIICIFSFSTICYAKSSSSPYYRCYTEAYSKGDKIGSGPSTYSKAYAKGQIKNVAKDAYGKTFLENYKSGWSGPSDLKSGYYRDTTGIKGQAFITTLSKSGTKNAYALAAYYENGKVADGCKCGQRNGK